MYYSEGKYPNLDVSQCSTGGQTWKVTLSTQGVFSTDNRVQGRLDYIAMNFTAPLELQDGYVLFGGGYSGTGQGTGSSPSIADRYTGPAKFCAIGSEVSDRVKVMQVLRL